MAITISKLVPPNILLSGTQLIKSGENLTDVGVVSTYTTRNVTNISVGKIFTNGAYVDEDGQTYTSNEMLYFLNNVTGSMFSSVYTLKRISMYANFAGNIPANWEIGRVTDNVYVPGESKPIIDAETAEIRYTLNGKDPSQTRARTFYGGTADSKALNTTASALVFNASSDNTVLKARVYRQGEWSDVKEVIFKILSPDQISVNGEILP